MPAKLEAILNIAQKYGIPLIKDATESLELQNKILNKSTILLKNKKIG